MKLSLNPPAILTLFLKYSHKEKEMDPFRKGQNDLWQIYKEVEMGIQNLVVQFTFPCAFQKDRKKSPLQKNKMVKHDQQ